jgi:hypothetical protein
MIAGRVLRTIWALPRRPRQQELSSSTCPHWLVKFSPPAPVRQIRQRPKRSPVLTAIGYINWGEGQGSKAHKFLQLALGSDPAYRFARLSDQRGVSPVRDCGVSVVAAESYRSSGDCSQEMSTTEAPWGMVSMDSSSMSWAWVASAGTASSSVKMKSWLIVLLPGVSGVRCTLTVARRQPLALLLVLRPRQRLSAAGGDVSTSQAHRLNCLYIHPAPYAEIDIPYEIDLLGLTSAIPLGAE